MAKKKETTLTSWDDVNLKLKELCNLTIERREIENAQTDEITKIKAKWDDMANAVTGKIKEIEDDITRFAENNKGEFLKKRSKKLAFGTVAFRATRKIALKNASSVISALKAAGMACYIRKTETVDKEALLSLTDNELAPFSKVGITVKREDKISIEPDIVEVIAKC